MALLEKLRNSFFWMLDALRGGPVKKHLEDVARTIGNFDEHMEAKTKAYLDSLLAHATATTQFYSRFDPENIHSFPVVNKNVIRENIDAFISSKFNKEDLVPATTSGSTGTPFRVYHDRNKKLRNTADTMFFAGRAGYTLGNKLFYFKIWSNNNRKSQKKLFFENIVPVDVLNLKENCADVVAVLNKQTSPVSFIGYVSAFETLCKYLEKKNALKDSLKVSSIITMSESLDENTRQAAQHYFRCPVVSRYSNIENGILAQQTHQNPTAFTVNRASYLIEIFDAETDTVLKNGEMGRIVVTDLFNFGMPMVRYDTGDMGILNEVNTGGRTEMALTHIEGRKLDSIFNTRGELISSYIIYKNMWQYTEIEQYQFIQTGVKEYIFRISMDGKFDRENKLRQEFISYLGEDADFRVEYVAEIPLLASGKRKKVVNLMQKQNA